MATVPLQLVPKSRPTSRCRGTELQSAARLQVASGRFLLGSSGPTRPGRRDRRWRGSYSDDRAGGEVASPPGTCQGPGRRWLHVSRAPGLFGTRDFGRESCVALSVLTSFPRPGAEFELCTQHLSRLSRRFRSKPRGVAWSSMQAGREPTCVVETPSFPHAVPLKGEVQADERAERANRAMTTGRPRALVRAREKSGVAKTPPSDRRQTCLGPSEISRL
jgi:hypothetical protein